MIDVKKAVASAVKYIKELYPQKNLRDLRLEEVERSDDEQYWLVTLGFSVPVSSDGSAVAQALGGTRYERAYKLFKVNAQTGEVRSMKIRKVR